MAVDLFRYASLYLRELDQLGSPKELVKYLNDSPFRGVELHANAEHRSKTLKWAEVLKGSGYRLGMYTTPGGLTPTGYGTQVPRMTELARKAGCRRVGLDMEAPWRDATPDQVLGCLRLAAARGHDVYVTTVPGHTVLRAVARLQRAAIAVQIYDRYNRYSEARIRAICASARAKAPGCDFDVPAWNKDAARLTRHLRNVPPCQTTRYWMADNPGTNDLPGQDLLKVIAEFDPALRSR